MAAYVIADVNITDPAGFEEYRKLKPGTSVRQYGGEFVFSTDIARGDKCEVLEGDCSPSHLVVIKFESFEQAKKWHASTEYAKAKGVRQKASESNLIVVERS